MKLTYETLRRLTFGEYSIRLWLDTNNYTVADAAVEIVNNEMQGLEGSDMAKMCTAMFKVVDKLAAIEILINSQGSVVYKDWP